MKPPKQTGLSWIKARKSYATSQCVELADAGELIALRNSRHVDREIYFTRAEIDAFLDGAQRGEFDHLR
jgi:Domain of unknown function (DUF397)